MGLCGGNETVEPKQFDPLFPGAGGQELRSQVFGYLPGIMEQNLLDNQAAVGAAQQAAGGFGQIGSYANQALGGRFLNRSPQLDRAMGQSRRDTTAALQAARQASDVSAQGQYDAARASLGDQQRRLQSQYARSGQTFGTGAAQAQDAANVALNAQIARNEAARQGQLAASEQQTMADMSARNLGLEAGRLQQERQLQQQAAPLAASAATKPFEILSAVPGLRYGGLNEASTLTGALAGGGSVVNPGSYYKPGALDYGLQAASIGAMLSDETLKDNIEDIDPMLERIMMVQPKSYTMGDSVEQEYGVIAQEIEDVFPELVTTVNHPEFGEKKAVNYQQLAVLALAALQELTERVEALEEEM